MKKKWKFSAKLLNDGDKNKIAKEFDGYSFKISDKIFKRFTDHENCYLEFDFSFEGGPDGLAFVDQKDYFLLMPRLALCSIFEANEMFTLGI